MFKILEKLTAKNKKQDDIRMPSHLSAAEQKQVQTVIDRARGDSTVPHSAQDSIPFQRMFPDGICRVTDNYYTKTIQFQDINYQLAQQEDQTAIFEEWCSFLNFFDSSIRFELSFMNMATDASNFEKMVRIPYQKDHFNPVRTEYSTMLRRQLAQGNNGLTKTKYLTFGIEAESMKQDFLDMESSQIVTMHIQSVDQNKAIKSIKHTITELDRSKIEEQKKAVRSGYDMDISATRS